MRLPENRLRDVFFRKFISNLALPLSVQFWHRFPHITSFLLFTIHLKYQRLFNIKIKFRNQSGMSQTKNKLEWAKLNGDIKWAKIGSYLKLDFCHKSTEKGKKYPVLKIHFKKSGFIYSKANLSFDLCRTKLILCSSGSDESAKIPFPFRPNYDPNQIKRTKKY